MDVIRLSELERDIIVVSAMDADASYKDLARQVGCELHRFHYAMKRLIERKVLRKVWVIDFFRAGLSRYNIFFSLAPASARAKKKLISVLVAAPRTVYLSEVGGDYDFELSIVAHNANEAMQFMHFVSKQCGDVFFTKSVSTRDFLVHFPRKYLSNKRGSRDRIVIGGEGQQVETDDFDRQILQALALFPFASQREVASKLGRPQSTVDVRISRLVKNGLIRGALFSTNSALYGALTYKLLLFARGFSEKVSADLREFSAKHPHVTSFVAGLGEWDFELLVECEQYSQLLALREELLIRFPALSQIKILSRFAVHKYAAYGAALDS